MWELNSCSLRESGANFETMSFPKFNTKIVVATFVHGKPGNFKDDVTATDQFYRCERLSHELNSRGTVILSYIYVLTLKQINFLSH